MDIEINKGIPDEVDKAEVTGWPIWQKEVSRFDWFYEQTEDCFLLEGKVVVESKDGAERVEFGAGDYVTFPKDLACIWDIKEPVKKHYRFR